jgi:Na+-driven multidrug efflux pump
MYIAFISQIIILLGLVYGMDWLGVLTPERVWLSILAAQASRFVMTAWVFARGELVQQIEIRGSR